MTVTLTAQASSVTVESDGDILRGTAVAFGTFGVADVGSKGQRRLPGDLGQGLHHPRGPVQSR